MQKIALKTMTAVLLIAVAISAMYWGMYFFFKQPYVQSVQNTQTTASQKLGAQPKFAAATHLFGVAKDAAKQGTNSLIGAHKIVLNGLVFADNAKQSAAIMKINAADAQAFFVGDEVAQGLRLEAIHNDYVLLAQQADITKNSVEHNAEAILHKIMLAATDYKNAPAASSTTRLDSAKANLITPNMPLPTQHINQQNSQVNVAQRATPIVVSP